MRSLSRNSTVTNATSSLRPASSSRFSDHCRQRLAVQAQLRYQKLQTAALVLHRLQPLRLTDVHAAEPRLPAIERRRADSVLPAKIRRLHTSLMLLQDPDDLLFRVPALLHRQLPRFNYERTPASTGGVFRGQVNTISSPLHNATVSQE